MRCAATSGPCVTGSANLGSSNPALLQHYLQERSSNLRPIPTSRRRQGSHEKDRRRHISAAHDAPDLKESPCHSICKLGTTFCGETQGPMSRSRLKGSAWNIQ